MDIASIADALLGGDAEEILTRSKDERRFLIYVVGDAMQSLQYTAPHACGQEWINAGSPTYEITLVQSLYPQVYLLLVQESLELKTRIGCTIRECLIYTCGRFCRHWQAQVDQRGSQRPHARESRCLPECHSSNMALR